MVADFPRQNEQWEKSAMSQPSRRPTREARRQHKQKRRAVQRELRAHRAAASVSNRLCPYSTEAEEQAALDTPSRASWGYFGRCYRSG
jgi:hypothetical protein